MKEPGGKFLRIACPKCQQICVVFGKSSLETKCKKCNHLLTRTSGGKAQIKAPVKEVLWR